MKQKAVYLNCGEYTTRRANEDTLNKYIEDGWTVKQITLGNNSNGCCFGYAILETEDEKPVGIEMSSKLLNFVLLTNILKFFCIFVLNKKQ